MNKASVLTNEYLGKRIRLKSVDYEQYTNVVGYPQNQHDKVVMYVTQFGDETNQAIYSTSTTSWTRITTKAHAGPKNQELTKND